MGTSIEDQRLALALEATRLGTWTWDMAAGVTTWDERLEELHGMPPGGFGGTFDDWVAALHPDDRAECLARVNAALACPAPYVLFHRTIWADGSVHSIECRGTVLVDDDGQPIGTTGVAIDVTARELHEAAITEALAHEQLLVQTFQHALLPAAIPRVPGTTIAARYVAAETNVEIGGDWYAVLPLPGDRLGVAIGDVAGHGLHAVADMASARFSLRALALADDAPQVVLERLNETVRTFGRDSMITALYGVLDPKAGTWSYATAGQTPAILRRGDGTVTVLDEIVDAPLGVADHFDCHTVTTGPGATLVLYTDGLIERRREPITEGIKRLEVACTSGPRDGEALCDYLLDELLRDTHHEDDVALVVVTLS